MELASRWGVGGSKGSGLPWRKLAFQIFQAAILVSWRDIHPPNEGALVPAPFAILELSNVSNANEICIWCVMHHCIYCKGLCNLCSWYRNKIDLTWLDLTARSEPKKTNIRNVWTTIFVLIFSFCGNLTDVYSYLVYLKAWTTIKVN